jgi:metal-responsive CopG/Arc/MetJ family transcriptional regulator
MPTKKDILNFAIDKRLLKRLDDFRNKNHIWSRSEAIRRLLHESLEKYEQKDKK